MPFHHPNLDASVVAILDVRKSIIGTGFFATDALIVTCAHVVAEAGYSPGDIASVQIQTTQQIRDAEVVRTYWSEEDDVAILALPDGIGKGVRPVFLDDVRDINGHSFKSFGYPMLGEYRGIWAAGDIVGWASKSKTGMLQLRSPELDRGHSGAPVLDVNTQKVVGVVAEVNKLKYGGKNRDTAFAIPVKTLLKISALLPHGQETRWNKAASLRYLDDAIVSCNQVLQIFETQYVYPNECDLARRKIIAVWDEHLLAFFNLLGNTDSLPENVVKFRDATAMESDFLFQEVQEITESIKDFRSICMAEQPKSKKMRMSIYKRIEQLRITIKNISDRLKSK